MRIIGKPSPLLLVCVLVAACGSRAPDPAGAPAPAGRDEGPVYRIQEVDVRPTIEGCTLTPAATRERYVRITVEFIVLPDGSVGHAAARRAFDAELVDLAENMARSCHYTPAQKDGKPVAVRMRRTFALGDPRPVETVPSTTLPAPRTPPPGR